jgi:adenylosuccinate synthase
MGCPAHSLIEGCIESARRTANIDALLWQVGNAYEQTVARQTALAYDDRDRHRIDQETSMSVKQQHQVLEASDNLLAQCITLTGASRLLPPRVGSQARV